jgi:GNAT superfamily N-acetyltransferase
MKIIRTSEFEVSYIDEDSDEMEDFDIYQAMDEADEIFNTVKIRQSNDNRYCFVATIDEKVIGAVSDKWSIDNDDMTATYSWDIAVDPEYQREGVGKKLINSVIQKYESDKDIYEEMDYKTQMRLWVVNPNLADYLETLNFDIESAHGNQKHMIRY